MACERIRRRHPPQAKRYRLLRRTELKNPASVRAAAAEWDAVGESAVALVLPWE